MMMFYEWIYPIMLKVYRQIHKKQIHILTERTELPGGKIYMLNHSCRWDSPISACVIEKHVFWLVGKQSLEFVDRFGCWMNGAILVDRKSKKDRKKSYKKMKRLLKNDKSILIFPEATWNLSDSVPMLPIYWGDKIGHGDGGSRLCHLLWNIKVMMYIFVLENQCTLKKMRISKNVQMR